MIYFGPVAQAAHGGHESSAFDLLVGFAVSDDYLDRLLHQGIDERNSTAAIGIRASAQLNRIWPRYTGKERDSESGLDYFGARMYGSSMGRFMSPDPITLSRDLENPQSHNKYSYTFNNPITAIDPDGRWPFWIHNLIYEFAFEGVYSSSDIGS